MNNAALKTYAPAARRDFIAAVTRRAELLGLDPQHPAEARVQGEALLIDGRAFPAKLDAPRRELAERIAEQGYAVVMEAMAYTWFNRLVAIRYMELHDYLDHGYRVLSHPDNKDTGHTQPEILDHITDLDLPGLDQQAAIDLKLAGNKDEELYRELLLAQCHALHQAMPFLFEAIDDATELLLPDGLLRTDSLIAALVTEIDEADWEEVEIIGWLYQFYISEKKDQVIGKVVKSEDIPAATQLFTPNWIVKYMVQNSLGAQWLATYPDSPLKGQMEYYIEPAEQTDEVKAQLAAITPGSLNPEQLTLIDPASGSGHILVEAYELFKAIYLERGYRQRDVPQLILEKNLFGLDIDERAAQLTGFALMMKGRADDRRLFERGVKLNVMALVDSAGFDAEVLAKGVELGGYGLEPGDLTELKRLFEHATTFGSLIQVPDGLASSLPALKQLSEATSPDLFVAEAIVRLASLVRQAEVLVTQYNAVVANPPYMGGRGMPPRLKALVKGQYPGTKNDLYAAFVERSYSLAWDTGYSSMVTMQSWMFLSSFEVMRENMLRSKTIRTMTQIGYNSFPSMNSKVAQATVFSLTNDCIADYRGSFTNLNAAPQSADKQQVFRSHDPANSFVVDAEQFKMIPGSPIAYWVSQHFRSIFSSAPQLAASAKPRQGLATSDNDRFLRHWSEPSLRLVGIGMKSRQEASASKRKWFPCQKGGPYRKWYGNNDLVVNWENDGRELLECAADLYGSPTRTIKNIPFYFREGITWGTITSSFLSMRYCPTGFIFETKGAMCFADGTDELIALLGFSNSPLVNHFLSALSPTLDFHEGPVGRLPYLPSRVPGALSGAKICTKIARGDWDSYERSWDFQSLPILTASSDPTPTLESSYTAWITQNRDTIAEMKRLEEENNRLFIDAYGLGEELTPDVPIEQITLTVNPAYRYGGKLDEAEQWTRFRQDTMEELVSYAIGCMMGRYSLDAPGLIYADSGNEGFDPSQYASFPADDDGIIPITDTEWFDDDTCNRLETFIGVAWDSAHLEQNLAFLAENLSPKRGESSRDTIRRYLSDKFFKAHLQTYKKRPIYWLFSSGKQKAFEALVYLHRYNASTLSRMRMEYVVPLQSRLQARIDSLQDDINAATSSTTQRKLQKQQDKRIKQQEELRRFDEELRHYADQRITLDLDDGVKVNYGKFGNLLAEVKAITGKKPEVK